MFCHPYIQGGQENTLSTRRRADKLRSPPGSVTGRKAFYWGLAGPEADCAPDRRKKFVKEFLDEVEGAGL